MASTTDPRRLGGVGRLYGEDGALVLKNAHVVVVGMGGVGSWAVEALARTGVGHLTLIDGDTVALSNTNRQLHAHDGNYDRFKVDAMKDRVALINPDCEVDVIPEFVSAETLPSQIPLEAHYVIDAIDDLRGKTALVAYCHANHLPVVVSGGAAARIDPSKLMSADLSQVKGDPLLAKLRTFLRKNHGFPAGSKDPKKTRKFGIVAVFSDEPLKQPGLDTLNALGEAPTARVGFGSGMVVTASCGLQLAAIVLNGLISQAREKGIK